MVRASAHRVVQWRTEKLIFLKGFNQRSKLAQAGFNRFNFTFCITGESICTAHVVVDGHHAVFHFGNRTGMFFSGNGKCVIRSLIPVTASLRRPVLRFSASSPHSSGQISLFVHFITPSGHGLRHTVDRLFNLAYIKFIGVENPRPCSFNSSILPTGRSAIASIFSLTSFTESALRVSSVCLALCR